MYYILWVYLWQWHPLNFSSQINKKQLDKYLIPIWTKQSSSTKHRTKANNLYFIVNYSFNYYYNVTFYKIKCTYDKTNLFNTRIYYDIEMQIFQIKYNFSGPWSFIKCIKFYFAKITIKTKNYKYRCIT